MVIYVDDFRVPARVGPVTARWSHLAADTHEELMTFAARIRLRAEWLQHAGTVLEHFDVTDAVRAKAIAAGAVSITYHQLGELVQRKRAQQAAPGSVAAPAPAPFEQPPLFSISAELDGDS